MSSIWDSLAGTTNETFAYRANNPSSSQIEQHQQWRRMEEERAARDRQWAEMERQNKEREAQFRAECDARMRESQARIAAIRPASFLN